MEKLKHPFAVPSLLGLAAVGLLAATLATACTGAATGAAGALPPGVGTPATAASAGVATGRAVDGRGQPLADVHVDLSGPATASGTTNFYYPTTDATGTYRQVDITPGIYNVQAWRELTYNGRTYKLPLAPAQGRYGDPLPSAAGIVRDFVFRINGEKPGYKGTGEEGAHYGGLIVYWGADFASNALDLPEAGTKIAYTLTPDGPLMDGSAGQPIEEAVAFKKSGYVQMAQRADVPLGRYAVKAEAKLADGTTKALRVTTKVTTDDADYLASAPLEFLPNTASNLRPYQERPTQKVNVYLRI